MQIQKVSNNRLLYKDVECSLWYRCGSLIYQAKNKKQVKEIGRFVNKISLLERAARLEARCAAKVDDSHFIVSFNGEILNYDIENNAISTEHKYAKGMKNPLSFLSIVEDGKSVIYYGEYIWNGTKEKAVSIYKRTSGKWEEQYCFPAHTITHIHALIEDKFRKGIIILTGDDDEGPGIWFSDYEFSNVVPILVGSQQYRACVAFPTLEGIYYATDTPLEQNYIYFLELKDGVKQKNIEKKFELPGPCIYGTSYKGQMYFATSVEPDSSLQEWRYRVTYKLGKGVKDRASHIIVGDKNGLFKDEIRISKDPFPMWLFQFGNILFPHNESGELYAVLQSTVKGHGNTIVII